MLQFSNAWLGLLMDISIKSLLLAILAALTLAVFRIRNTNAQHRVWTAVLIGMLALPCLVHVTPRIPLPKWISIASIGRGLGLRTAETTIKTDAYPDTLDNDRAERRRNSHLPARGHGHDLASFAQDPPLQSTTSTTNNATDTAERVDNQQAKAAIVVPSETSAATLFWSSRPWTIAFVLTHIMVTSVLLARLAIGLLLTRRMVCDGIEIEDAGRLESSRVQLLESSQISVPLAVGFLHRKVVLPTEWREWTERKLQSVSVHELAHIHRADWLVGFLSQLNLAMYWFHPLAWYLRRQLADLAEQNCDDAVIEASGDRAEYARHLLEIASGLTEAGSRYLPPQLSVAMARKPAVERRIDAILDDARPLAKRLGFVGAVAILTLIIPAIWLAAALGNDGEAKNENSNTDKIAIEKLAESTTAAETSATNSDDETPFVYAGQVLTPDGKPASGAEIQLVYWYWDQSQTLQSNPVAITDNMGRFRFTMTRDDFNRTGDSVPPWQWASLVATKKGFGLAWASSVALEQTGSVLAEINQLANRTGRQGPRFRDMLRKQRGPLRLSTEDPRIEGKVVNTEGQPIANVRVSLIELYTGEDDTLDKWLEATRKPRADFFTIRNETPKHLYGPLARKLIPAVTTNAQGEFTMSGIGHERLARLLFEAPTIESADVYCRTRSGDKIQLDGSRQAGSMQVFGPKIVYVATPSKPVVGVVRDTEGQPLSGVVVKSMQWHTQSADGGSARKGNDFAKAVTDEQGRYRLTGLPNADGNPVRFMPAADSPFLPNMSQVDTSGTDDQPVQLNVELEKGVAVSGRVIDSDTGKGVSGQVMYLISNTNASLKNLRRNYVGLEESRSDTDGNFRITVPNGKGHLTFRAFDDTFEKKAYQPDNTSPLSGYTISAFMVASKAPEFHATAELDLTSADKPRDVEIQVSRAALITGVVVDSNGSEVTGGYYSGRNEYPVWLPLDGARFAVAGYDSKYPRRLTFVSEDHKLAGTIVLRGDLDRELRVTLQPTSTLKGRVVDEYGDPISEVSIMSGNFQRMMPLAVPDDAVAPDPSIPLPNLETRHDDFITDTEGRFTIAGLVGGVGYSLIGLTQNEAFPDQQIQGDIASDIVVEAGKTRDLGDVKLKKPDYEKLRREFEKARAGQKEINEAARGTDNPSVNDANGNASAGNSFTDPQSVTANLTTAKAKPIEDAPSVKEGPKSTRITIRGTVFAPDGRPLAGAKLYWPRTKTPRPQTLNDMLLEHVATSDATGAFGAALALPVKSDFLRDIPLYSIADGFGVTWEDIPLEAAPKEIELYMTEEFTVRGKVLNTEGEPVSGAKLELFSIMSDSSGSLDRLLRAWKSEWRSASMKIDRQAFVALPLLSGLLEAKPTDSQGRFEIRGLGREQAVWLHISSPAIATSTAVIINRSGFQPESYNRAALAQAGDMALMRQQTPLMYSGEVKIVVEPCKMIAGSVTDIETGKAIPGVHVHVSVGHGGNASSITDQDGRYELTGIPRREEILISFRKPETRYLPRTLAIKLSPGLASMHFDTQLATGVLLSGRVTEKESGRPVSGGIRFAPLPENEWQDKLGFDNYKRSRVMESVDHDGSFRFVSIRGPGVLLMQAYNSGIRIEGQTVKPYKKGRFSEEDRKRVKIRVDGESFYTSSNGLEFFQNGMKVLDIPEDVEEYACDVTVDRGLEIDVAIQDDNGQPLSGTMVCGMTESWPITFPVKETSCRIYALDPERPRRVIFYHEDRKLATMLTLRGDETEPRVAKLTPTNTLVGRAVGSNGEPLAGATVGFAWMDDISREFQRQLNMTQKAIVTAEDGHFRIEGALPGLFRLRFTLENKRYRSEKKWDDIRTIVSASIGTRGTEIQLGDITVVQR